MSESWLVCDECYSDLGPAPDDIDWNTMTAHYTCKKCGANYEAKLQISSIWRTDP